MTYEQAIAILIAVRNGCKTPSELDIMQALVLTGDIA